MTHHNLILFISLLFFTLSGNVAAIEATSQSTICTGVTPTGDYQGLMDVKMGEDKQFKGRSATFSLSDGMLTCDFPKLGKMPGRIIIQLPVTITNDTILSANPETNAGYMKMPMGLKFKLRLRTMEKAKIINSELSFIMTVYGQFMGKDFPSTISFRGKR